MIINDSTIKTEAEAFKARIIGDAIVNAFGAHKVNFSDFSNDFSGLYGSAGSIIRVPLIGKTGGVKTANADGTDDFSIGSKSTEYKDIELALKYVSCPLTIGEAETGAALADFAQSLANDVVEDVQKTLEEFGLEVSDEDALAFQEAYEQSQKQLELSATMEQMLDDCQAHGVILGIISNGPAEHQMGKARTMKMERWIPEDRILVSGAVGILKPDVRIFRLAEERMGLDPETMDIWFVGDSFANDIAGAAGAGWKTIWLNRRGKSVPEGNVVPDVIVGNDEELYQAVRGIVGDHILW
jgi:HAD superfamily hydrolase (TIGR01549 family)